MKLLPFLTRAAAVLSLPVVVAKAYAVYTTYVGKLLTYSYLRSFSKARVVSCLSKLTVVCCPVQERKSGNQLHEGEVRSRRVAGPSSGSSWQLYVTTI